MGVIVNCTQTGTKVAKRIGLCGPCQTLSCHFHPTRSAAPPPQQPVDGTEHALAIDYVHPNQTFQRIARALIGAGWPDALIVTALFTAGAHLLADACPLEGRKATLQKIVGIMVDILDLPALETQKKGVH